MTLEELEKIQAEAGDDDELDSEEFAAFNALIEYLQTLPPAKTKMLNPKRLQTMKYANAIIQEVLKASGCEADITFKTGELGSSMGSIEVEGDSIDVDRTDWFARVAELASNAEVYPLANGNVRMTFTFHGLFVTSPE